MTRPALERTTSGDSNVSTYRYRQFGSDRSQPLGYVCDTYYTDNGSAPYGGAPDLSAANDLLVAAHNAAYAQFVSQMKSKVNMALNLAELPKTYQLLADSIRTLADVVGGIRHGDLKRLKRGLKAAGIPNSVRSFNKNVSKRWLEYQYAVKPLVDDITQVMNEQVLPAYGRHYRITSGASRSGYRLIWDPDRSPNYKYHYDSTVSVKLSSEVLIDKPWLYQASKTGLTNPFTLAYELVPYSFVLDWFVNLGDIISSIDDFVGVSLMKTYHTNFYRINYVWELDYGRYGHWLVPKKRNYMARSTSPFSGPKLELSWPITSPTRLMNAMALAVSSFH